MTESNRIFKMQTLRTEDDLWELITLEALSPPASDHKATTPSVAAFSNETDAPFVLSVYKYKNVQVKLAKIRVYGEQEESIGLSLIIDNKEIRSHGLLINNEETAFLTDRDGGAMSLGVSLPNMKNWIKECEKILWN